MEKKRDKGSKCVSILNQTPFINKINKLKNEMKHTMLKEL